MALLDAELVAHLVERGQVSLLVHHRGPAGKGGKRALLNNGLNTAMQELRARAEPGTVYCEDFSIFTKLQSPL